MKRRGSPVRFGDVPLSRLLVSGSVRFRRLYYTAMTGWSIVYGLPLLSGALISMLLERAAHHPVPHSVWLLLVLLVASMLARAAVLPLALQLTFRLIFEMSSWGKLHTLGELLGRSRDKATRHPEGEILNRLRNDTEEIGGLLEWTTDLIYRCVLTAVAVGILLVSDPLLTVSLLPLVGGVAVSSVLLRRVSETQDNVRVLEGELGSTITDTARGIRDLRLGGAVDARLEALGRRFPERRHFQVTHQLYSDLLSGLLRNLVLIGTAVILIVMSLNLADARFSVGKLALFVTYAGWLGQQMYFFGMILARYQGGRVSYGRLIELTQTNSSEVIADAGQAKLPPLHRLEVFGLTCDAPPGAAAPSSLSFSVEPGGLVVLVGEIGAGKSTLIRCLLGLQPHVVGELRWNGTVVGDPSRAFRSPAVSFAGQTPRFLGGSLRENLQLGHPEVSDATIVDALAAVDLRPGSTELPLGLDSPLDSGDANQLSGGQKQRLALARMLCHAADLYVVDDCDSSLDAGTAAEIWGRLRRRDDAAWIVVSRNVDLIAKADTVIEVALQTTTATTSA